MEIHHEQIVVTVLLVLLTIALTTVQARRIFATWISRLRLQLVVLQKTKRELSTSGNSSTNASLHQQREQLATPKVEGLYIYPVKSLRTVSLSSATLDERGFVHDRRFMLVSPCPLPLWGSFGPNDATHQFVTQRQCPVLATITAQLDEKANLLTLSHHQGKDETILSIPLTLNATTATNNPSTFLARLWDDVVKVVDVGDEAAAFLQAIVDQDTTATPVKGIRLVAQSLADTRVADDSYVPPVARTWMGTTPRVALSDGFPLLLACQASLDELNRRLVAKGQPAISMSRFRPNIVIEGTEPFAEDTWKTIVIGDNVVLHVVKGCPRCKQSCTDQQTGQVFEEPLLTLSEFRAHGEGAYFAQNVVPHHPRGTIRVGAPVTILSSGAPVWDREPVVPE